VPWMRGRKGADEAAAAAARAAAADDPPPLLRVLPMHVGSEALDAGGGGGEAEPCPAPDPDAAGPRAGRRLPCPLQHHSDHFAVRATIELLE